MKFKSSITQINILSSLFLQLTTILSGFVIPRVILQLFGSDANGLISSVSQFLNYIQLVEGGLGGVVMAALYKPLNQRDDNTISVILKTASRFFRRIGIIYIVYLIGLSFIYPICKDTGYNYKYSILLILVLGTNLVIQYFLSITYRLLLNADRKVYVVTLTQSVINILNVLLVLICSVFFNDLLIIKLCSAIVFIIQPIVFSIYIKKHYNVDNKIKPNKNLLDQRWVAFGTNLAFFVHTNTDIVILTVFSSYSDISVYSVYLLVVTAMKGIIAAISSAFVPSFGKALAEGDKNHLNDTFQVYEFVVQISSFIMFTCGSILIVPFVMLYTNGITDADYYQPVFAILIILAEFIYCLRDPYVQATSAAAMFRCVAPHAYIEAVCNILISVLLVQKLGIVGVAVGTIIAMIYRMSAQVFIVNKIIMKQSSIFSFIKLGILVCVLLSMYFIFSSFVHLSIDTVVKWILFAGIVLIIVSVFAYILCKTIYRNAYLILIDKIRKK